MKPSFFSTQITAPKLSGLCYSDKIALVGETTVAIIKQAKK